MIILIAGGKEENKGEFMKKRELNLNEKHARSVSVETGRRQKRGQVTGIESKKKKGGNARLGLSEKEEKGKTT